MNKESHGSYGGNRSRRETRQLVERYELMVEKNEHLFFDHDSFEYIIEYYEDQEQIENALKVIDYALSIYTFSSYFIVKKAQFLFEGKNYKTSIALLEKARLLSPCDIDVYLAESAIYLYIGKYKKAYNLLIQAFSFADEEDKLEIYLGLSEVMESQGKIKEAFDYLVESTNLSPNNEETLFRLDNFIETHQYFEQGIELLQQITNKCLFDPISWYALGNAYFGLDLFEKAIECYKFSYSLDDTFDASIINCAQSYLCLKNYKESQALFLEAADLLPTDEEIQYQLGVCYFEQKELEKSIQYLNNAVELNPAHANSYFQMGETYRAMQEPQKAINSYKKALEIEPQNDNFLFCLAPIFVEFKNYEKALNLYSDLVKIAPNKPEYWIDYAKLLLFIGSENNALLVSESSLESLPNNPHLLYLNAACLFYNYKNQEGLIVLSKALFNDHTLVNFFLALYPNAINNKDINNLIKLF